MADEGATIETRKLLLDCYRAAVQRAHPGECLAPHVPSKAPKGRIIVVGAGKANAGESAMVGFPV